MTRECDVCKKKYIPDQRNLKRGWGLCCSKSCSAIKRESNKKKTHDMEIGKEHILRMAKQNYPEGTMHLGFNYIDCKKKLNKDSEIFQVKGELKWSLDYNIIKSESDGVIYVKNKKNPWATIVTKEEIDKMNGIIKTEYTGGLKGFPDYVIEYLLFEQERQGNPRDPYIFDNRISASFGEGGINWAQCVIGKEEMRLIMWRRVFHFYEETIKNILKENKERPTKHSFPATMENIIEFKRKKQIKRLSGN